MTLSGGSFPGMLPIHMFWSFNSGWLASRNLVLGCVRGAGPGAWLAGLGILALLVTLRWNSFDVPLMRDEGEYAYAARLFQRGLHPYEHAFLQKPPMIVYTYALAGAVAPKVFWFPRVLAALFAALVPCMLGLIARLEFGPGCALPTMWLATPMLLCPGLWQFTANTEMFMILPLLATVAVYVVSRHNGLGLGAWFLAGFLGAIALWYKYRALPVLAVLFGVWSIEEWLAGGRSRLWRGLVGIAGAGVASLVVLAPFLIWDGGRRLWECTVVFNRVYRASASFGWSGLLAWLLAFWVSWWFLFLLAAFLLVRPRRRALAR